MIGSSAAELSASAEDLTLGASTVAPDEGDLQTEDNQTANYLINSVPKWCIERGLPSCEALLDMQEPVPWRISGRWVELHPSCTLGAKNFMWPDLSDSKVSLQSELALGLHRAERLA